MEWQPIETAPKDGTTVILGHVGGDWSGRWADAGHWHAGAWACHNGDEFEPPSQYAPTHWMPLPAPPDDGA